MSEDGFLGVVLDYPAFDLFTHRLRGERGLIAALKDYRNMMLRSGAYVDPQTFLLDRLASPRG
jgi:hypothetical protein